MGPVIVPPSNGFGRQPPPHRGSTGIESVWNLGCSVSVTVEVHRIRLRVLERAVSTDAELGMAVVVGNLELVTRQPPKLEATSNFNRPKFETA